MRLFSTLRVAGLRSLHHVEEKLPHPWRTPSGHSPRRREQSPVPTIDSQEVIARHEAMIVGFRANGSANSGVLSTVAVDHCEQLIASVRATLRQSF
jgi:hypothetical protein